VKRVDNQIKSSVIEVITFGEAEPSQFALVLAVGPGSKREDGSLFPLEVQPGDTVILKKLCGSSVFLNGEACHLVMRDDLLAVIDL
jgi:chaperonin GroES